MERATVEELQSRIQTSEQYYGGTLPREAVFAWYGYLAGLIEWGVLSVSEHATLVDLLPRIEASPIFQIILGWESESDRPEWLVEEMINLTPWTDRPERNLDEK